MSDGSAAAGAPPAQSDSAWTRYHTFGLLLIVVIFVWMALSRPWGMFPSWLVVMVALAAFVLTAGHGIKGVWFGALIDERNKMSLSRLQMFTWTVLVLAAYGTVAIARVGVDPSTALDVMIPQTLWLLMGISTTSLVASPLIKGNKKHSNLALRPDEVSARLRAQGKDPGSLRVEGQIVSNEDMTAARFSDLFMGEEVANVGHLDLAKIQMFFFTVLIVLSYGVAIGSLLRTNVVPQALPDIGEGTLTLLGISHSGYLVNKAVPVTR